METVILDGKEFVKASKAAKDLGYTADHVGQLCRNGKVTARLVGRAWYVLKDDLQNHKVEKKRILRAKAREQAKKSIEEHRKSVLAARSNGPTRAIRYEPDDRELIPQTRKLGIHSSVAPSEPSLKSVEEEVRLQEQSFANDIDLVTEVSANENAEKLTNKPKISRSVSVTRSSKKVSSTPSKAIKRAKKEDRKEENVANEPQPGSSVAYYISSTLVYAVICALLVCSTGTAWHITYVNDGIAKASHRITWSLEDVIENMRLLKT